MTDTTIITKVARKVIEAKDIVSFELVSNDGGDLPEFTAGSHIDVHINDELVRQYSLCNAPSERHRYLLGILREVESTGGSVAMHDQVNVGDVLTISQPRNSFHLLEDASYSLLLAGGIGITPILCMAQRLSEIERDFDLHYCTRTVARTAFRDLLVHSSFSARVHFHHDDGDKAQLLDIPGLLASRPDDANLYVCGPKGFMDIVIETAEKSWPADSIHREYFSADPMAGHEDDETFVVKIASNGAEFVVLPDKTIVEVLKENDIHVPVSCEQGICGTCLVGVLDGIPEHRDYFQTDEEQEANNQMTVCCSRAKSKEIVLDL